jgi:hypothetical protein
MSIAKVLVRTSRRVFVTADTHFGHAEAISKFARRHRDADAMDEAMIAAINEVVGAKDILVHLGDFSGPRAWGARTAPPRGRSLRRRRWARSALSGGLRDEARRWPRIGRRTRWRRLG